MGEEGEVGLDEAAALDLVFSGRAEGEETPVERAAEELLTLPVAVLEALLAALA